MLLDAGGGEATTSKPEKQDRPTAAPSVLQPFEHTHVQKLSPMPDPTPGQGVPGLSVELPPTGYGKKIDSMIYGQDTEIQGQPDKPTEPGQPDPTSRHKSYQMTWGDYNALTDRQRAAVDFNTMLVQAREKDLNTDYHQTAQQQATYEKAVERMFGANGGSETYAPETMAVLNQIDFTPTDNKQGDTLDDFLGLKAAISEKDLENFTIPKTPLLKPAYDVVGSFDGRDTNAEFNAQLVAKTRELESSLAKGNEVLQNFQASAKFARNEDLAYFGGVANDVHTPLGFGSGADDQYIQQAYAAIAEKRPGDEESLRSSLPMLYASLEQRGLKDDFLKYADARTRQAAQYGVPLIGGDKTARTPQEYRALLGLTDKAGE